MYDLTLIKQNGGVYIDSREVAAAIGKRHDHLLRDIARYREIIVHGGLPKIGESDFFIESNYLNAQNREMPCYLVSRVGCDLVAHKLTGKKGVLFTCAYVTKFREMEAAELAEREAELEAELEALALAPRRAEPRLGEVNAFSRLIVTGMKAIGATPEQVMGFLKETYEPMGFDFGFDSGGLGEDTAPRWYNANGIAKECGIYSLSGKPHGQAAASILKDVLFIGEDHMRYEKDHYGFQVGISTLYDDFALLALLEWLRDNECPEDIEVSGRTFHVQYRL
jgi:Rha family phage regulatory protein